MRDAKTILVVDDVAMFRELASVFLARTARVRMAAGSEPAPVSVRQKPAAGYSPPHISGR